MRQTWSGCFLTLLLSLAHVGPGWSQVTPGQPAPDFTLQDITGTSYTLSDFRGRVVLLDLLGWG